MSNSRPTRDKSRSNRNENPREKAWLAPENDREKSTNARREKCLFPEESYIGL